jgi:hypothetical protein
MVSGWIFVKERNKTLCHLMIETRNTLVQESQLVLNHLLCDFIHSKDFSKMTDIRKVRNGPQRKVHNGPAVMQSALNCHFAPSPNMLSIR